MDLSSLSYSPVQRGLLSLPISSRIFLEGLAGTGKTTAGAARLGQLLDQGIPANQILVILPQRTLAGPYLKVLRAPDAAPGGMASVLTVGGLAQRMVDLFWPLVAEPAGFARPDLPPTFLTLETAQYYIARLVRPLLDEGFFSSVTLSPNRLYSQILDNLNKSAFVGFPSTEIGPRLKAAWHGETSQLRVYDDVQTCATRFRNYCLEHNLLDFSLQIEVFKNSLWPNSLCQDTLIKQYRHLIADNLEEDTPAAHDLLAAWLPYFDSALMIYDQQAGYRRFLGADQTSALALKPLCSHTTTFNESFVTSPALVLLGASLGRALKRPPDAAQRLRGTSGAPDEMLFFESKRYYPQMLDWVAAQVTSLVNDEGVPPSQIAVLSPFLTDALRFSLVDRLERAGIPVRSHRPSRALRDEPATTCLLTLAALAHPGWGLRPGKYDIAYAMIQAIDGLDLVRAQLLIEEVYRVRAGLPELGAFERISPNSQERITYRLGQRYDRLRLWLDAYHKRPVEEVDVFFSRLFGELLSQPGFGFHANFGAGEVAANLVESARKFRWAVTDATRISPPTETASGADNAKEAAKPLGLEYLEMVRDGVVAAQYIRSWGTSPEDDGAESDSVLLSPAHTFLMGNRPVDVQFWLDVGSRGWFERLNQPLTHPYVLSRDWPAGHIWSDADEFEANQDSLYRLALGLMHRCRRRIYLGLNELSEQGYEQKGPLIAAMQRVLRDMGEEGGNGPV
jgi:hypothetical protein